MSKIHPVAYDEPHQFEGPIVVPCHKFLNKPQIVFCWDEQAMGERADLNRLAFCTKCIAKLSKGSYVYGLSEGEEAQQEDAR